MDISIEHQEEYIPKGINVFLVIDIDLYSYEKDSSSCAQLGSILLKITDEKLTYGKRLFNVDRRGLVIEWIGCCCCGREY